MISVHLYVCLSENIFPSSSLNSVKIPYPVSKGSLKNFTPFEESSLYVDCIL
ncbi:hypothetical protein SFB4_055G2, partial [Candidatus Arthromitus sp. SFB-4]